MPSDQTKQPPGRDDPDYQKWFVQGVFENINDPRELAGFLLDAVDRASAPMQDSIEAISADLNSRSFTRIECLFVLCTLMHIIKTEIIQMLTTDEWPDGPEVGERLCTAIRNLSEVLAEDAVQTQGARFFH